jgi:hypothetical protein
LKLNTEIGGSADLSGIFNTVPAHEELPAPMEYLQVREGIIIVWFEQLEV